MNHRMRIRLLQIAAVVARPLDGLTPQFNRMFNCRKLVA